MKILGMNAFFTYLFLLVVVALVSPLLFNLINGAAFKQRPDQVAIRDPGERFLGPPQDAAPEASNDLEFALLSQAAYQRTPDAKQVKAGEAVDADATLEAMGWTRWKDFPSGDVKTSIDDVHLRVEVWSNSSTNKVAVTFGGTIARNIKDWMSDLRWFIPHHTDEYSRIGDTFGDAFIDEYQARMKKPGWEFLDHAKLFSTGHSLGGGLAQQFAYSLPLKAGKFQVEKVFAFDPSPVTGYYSVSVDLRDHNSANLSIDRIYERGEILAFFRALTNLVYPPSASQPTIRQLRYNLFYTLNPFAGHSMADLALKLQQVSQHKLP